MNAHTSFNNATPMQGELLKPAILTDYDVSYLNKARDHFDQLERMVRQLIFAIWGYERPEVVREMCRHLELVRQLSCNFCYQHHLVGDAYDAKEVRP